MSTEKPKVSSGFAQSEVDKAEKQFETFDKNLKELSSNRPMQPTRQTEEYGISQREIANSKDIYLKPKRRIGSREKFNENFRSQYEYAKEMVAFIAEHKELSGEHIEIWTKPFPGLAAEEWIVPTSKPVYGPRYLAEQIKRKYYNRLIMKENVTTSSDGMGTYYGGMAYDTTIARLDCHPVSDRKSVFMGKSSF